MLLKSAEKMLFEAKDLSDKEIEEQIKLSACNEAKSALSTYDVLEDGIYKSSQNYVKDKSPRSIYGWLRQLIKQLK